MRNRLELGKYNVICDRCGLQFKNDALRSEWTGLKVCGGCWEPRHPQTLIGAPRAESAPAWTRSEPPAVYIERPAQFLGDVVSGVEPLTVHFTDYSVGTPTTWSWDFGDSTTSTSQNPTKTYDSPGTYSVSLDTDVNSSTTKTNYITVAQELDPFFSSVTLLAHCNGANGSTTLTDNSSLNHTFTRQGGAVISTAQQKFGTASSLYAAVGDRFTTPYHAGFSWGTGDFTTECWIRPTAYHPGTPLGYSSHIIGLHVQATSNLWLLQLDSTGKLGWYNFNGSVGPFGATTVPLDQWTHVAATRSGGVLRLFVNGVVDATVADTNNYGSTATVFSTGGDSTGGADVRFRGYIDEIRITKGVARYTGTFTPRSRAFPNQ